MRRRDGERDPTDGTGGAGQSGARGAQKRDEPDRQGHQLEGAPAGEGGDQECGPAIRWSVVALVGQQPQRDSGERDDQHRPVPLARPDAAFQNDSCCQRRGERREDEPAHRVTLSEWSGEAGQAGRGGRGVDPHRTGWRAFLKGRQRVSSNGSSGTNSWRPRGAADAVRD